MLTFSSSIISKYVQTSFVKIAAECLFMIFLCDSIVYYIMVELNTNKVNFEMFLKLPFLIYINYVNVTMLVFD